MLQNMDIRHHRSWMYNRLLPGRTGYTEIFLKGLEEFISFACQQPYFLSHGKIRCPCSKCKNQKYLSPDEVKVNLLKKGFVPNYWYWTSHGESDPRVGGVFDLPSSTSTRVQLGNDEHNRYRAMIFDAVPP